MNEAKIKANESTIKTLENKMFKLLKNKPYNAVNTECDRIVRQIQELNNKAKSGKAAEGSN